MASRGFERAYPARATSNLIYVRGSRGNVSGGGVWNLLKETGKQTLQQVKEQTKKQVKQTIKQQLQQQGLPVPDVLKTKKDRKRDKKKKKKNKKRKRGGAGGRFRGIPRARMRGRAPRVRTVI